MDITRYKGLGDPLPIPAGRKTPPPKGTTGHEAAVVCTWKDVQAHVDKGGNWGLRVADELVVIDVDAHRNSEAAEVSAQFIHNYGLDKSPLHVSSRRKKSPYSGHYWFRLPKLYDPEVHELVSEYSPSGIPCVDILHRGHRYAIMPGSRNPKTGGTQYRDLRGYTGQSLPSLPEDLFHLLIRPKRKFRDVPPGYKFSKAEIDKAKGVASMAIFTFARTKEGNRDNQSYKACMAIGNLWRMTGDRDRRDRQLARMRQHAERNGADSETVRKMEGIIQDGFDKLRLPDDDSIGDDAYFWGQSPVYRSIFRYCISNEYNPWAMITALASALAVATDHRIHLEPWGTAHRPAPVALWLTLVGPSGAGKSATFDAAFQAVAEQNLTVGPLPPVIPINARDHGKELSRSKFDTFHESQGVSRLSRATPTTKNGVWSLFEGEASSSQPIMVRAKPTGKTRTAYCPAITGYRRMAYFDEPDILLARSAREYALLTTLQQTFYSADIQHVVGNKDGRFSLQGRTYSLSLGACVPTSSISRYVNDTPEGFKERMIFLDALPLSKPTGEREPAMRFKVREWLPVKKLNQYRGTIRFSKSATRYLASLDSWIRHGCKVSKEADVVEFLSFVPRNSAGHTTTQTARLAAMLARMDGAKMRDGRVTVKLRYVKDAVRILQESHRVLLSSEKARLDAVDAARLEAENVHVKREIAADKARRREKAKETFLARLPMSGVEFNKTTVYQQWSEEDRQAFFDEYGIVKVTEGRKVTYQRKETQ